jgi:hypothetical protein
MSATDAMIRRHEAEFEERQAFIEGMIAGAQEKNRDLNGEEMKMIGNARERQAELLTQLEPLKATADIAKQSRQRTAELDEAIHTARTGKLVGKVEYRSAGEYIADLYTARMGDQDAFNRLEVFHRVAAHQTTADNPGLLPERIVEPVVNGVDAARPLVTALGTQDLGAGSWAYARVTQHTQVDVQSAEKAEMASRKMTVTKTSITAPTYGGYVNVSKQDIRRTSPQVLDMIIADLGGQYAIVTEDACADALVAAATASTVDIPATGATALSIAQAVWGAAGQAAAGLRTANIPATGPVLAVAADKLGVIGPLFPNINPQNTTSSGFLASDLTMQGPQGAISGITAVLAAGLASGTVLFTYRSNVRNYEDRYGAMQVNEPSVWGVQVGYAGDFETVVFANGGVINIQTT